MIQRRQQLLQKIAEERQRQLNLPGSEYDSKRDPNAWLAIAGRYLFGSAYTKNIPINRADYEDDLIKAAAVILAALEHSDKMVDNGFLKDKK
jgi:hypothetical protein